MASVSSTSNLSSFDIKLIKEWQLSSNNPSKLGLLSSDLLVVTDGKLDAGSDRIVNVATPISSSDASTKQYVDSTCLDLAGVRPLNNNNSYKAVYGWAIGTDIQNEVKGGWGTSLDSTIANNRLSGYTVVEYDRIDVSRPESSISSSENQMQGHIYYYFKEPNSNVVSAEYKKSRKIAVIGDIISAKNDLSTSIKSVQDELSSSIDTLSSNILSGNLQGTTIKFIDYNSPSAEQKLSSLNVKTSTEDYYNNHQDEFNSNELIFLTDSELDALNKQLINVATPINDTDATNKQYVDATSSNITNVINSVSSTLKNSINTKQDILTIDNSIANGSSENLVKSTGIYSFAVDNFQQISSFNKDLTTYFNNYGVTLGENTVVKSVGISSGLSAVNGVSSTLYTCNNIIQNNKKLEIPKLSSDETIATISYVDNSIKDKATKITIIRYY